MSPEHDKAQETTEVELHRLLRTLHETQERIAELTGGGIDTITLPTGVTYLTEQAQKHLREREAEQRHFANMRAAILNALPAHIALLDPDGNIMVVNAAWMAYGQENCFQRDGFAIGMNYLDVCDDVRGENEEDASDAADGIRAVLEGRAREYSFEYPCHSPTEKRWFRMTVTPIDPNARRGVVVMHVDITRQVLADLAIKHSEERFRLLLEDVPSISVQGYASDGTVRYWNKASERLYGYTAEEALKSNLLDLIIPEEMQEGVRAAMHEALTTHGNIPAGELSLRRKDGSRVSVYSSHAILRQPDSPPELFCIDVDLSDQKELQRQLTESERRMRRMFSDAATGISITNPDGYYVDTNVAYCRMLGYTEEELHGITAISLTHPEDRERNRELIDGLLSGKSDSFTFEKRYVHKLGHTVWGRVSISAIRDSSGRVINVIGVTEDISERKEAEEQLRDKEALLRIAGKQGRIGGWAVTRGDGRVFWSDEVCLILDYPPGEVPGLDEAIDLYSLESRELIAGALERCLETGVPFDLELTMRTATGRMIDVRCSGEADRESNGEIRQVHGALQDITEQRAAEVERARLSLQLKGTLDNMSDAFVLLDREWRFLFMNREAERVLKRTSEGLMGRNMWEEFPGSMDTEAYEHYNRARTDNKPVSFRLNYKPLGEWLEINTFPSEEGLAIYFRVITERLALEEQLRQSQRLESVGQLTGGIAHDFNNLLTVIMGNAEMLMDELGHSEESRSIAESVLQAAKAGSELTHRLLAFARKQPLAPKSIDINELVNRMDKLLRRTLGEHVEVVFIKEEGIWNAMVDPAQLESAVLNLSLNSRDAMPGGGRLTIETGNAFIGRDYADQNIDVEVGQYVMVAVSDSGMGIHPEYLTKVFEPFFTTKGPGKGTGLGLSMVYGFVKQSQGHIKIYSEPGEGTTVRMYLPRTAGQSDEVVEIPDLSAIPGGAETILLAEDDEMVRSYASSQLVLLGYNVISVVNGLKALEIIRQRNDIDLLFTDIVMPGGMNGRQLADAARELRPGLRVLYTSGYTDNAIVHQGRLDPGAHLLSKPYGRAQLARKIREILDMRAE